MTTFVLPDYLPPWAAVCIVAVVAAFMLAFLVMPFAVFGVKGRLSRVEARLDEIQREIRSLSLRLPEPVRGEARRPEEGERQRWAEPPSRPPIPPRRVEADRPAPPPSRRVQPGPRSEPRFDPN